MYNKNWTTFIYNVLNKTLTVCDFFLRQYVLGFSHSFEP